MNASHPAILLQMRLLVGFLGERAQFAWWPTAFYESSSRLFLEPVFSKTSRLAQYHGVLEAARRLHDEHLNVGCYHLFRLPEEVEQDLHALLQGGVGEDLAKHSQNKEAALETLASLSTTNGSTVLGPISVGNIRDIDSPGTHRALATAYFTAFNHSVKTYPYLMS
jgi:hypothetical protein